MRGSIGVPCTADLCSNAGTPPSSGKADLGNGLRFRPTQGFPTVGLKTVDGKPLELKNGKWYYEVTIGEGAMDCPQFGWCDSNGLVASFEHQDEDGDTYPSGVGDDATSWGIDGDRVLKWHNGESKHWGEAWATGEVVGCMADLDAKTLSFSLNGDMMGVAFECIEFEGAIFPALSASGCDITCNFGADPGKPLEHMPEEEGYSPVVPPAAQERSAKLFLFSGKAKS